MRKHNGGALSKWLLGSKTLNDCLTRNGSEMEKCKNKYCHHRNLGFDSGCDLEWESLSDCSTHKRFNNLFDEIDQASKDIEIKDDMPKELEENIGQAELKAVKEIIIWKQWFMRTNILFAISRLFDKPDAK